MNSIVVTCGTSIFARFRDVRDTTPPDGEFWKKFSKLSMTDPDAGAELNALSELESEYGVSLRDSQIYLVVTDTDRGRFVGKILKKYLTEIRELGHVEVEEVRGLTFDDEKFYREGLPRLVRTVARALKKGSPHAYLLPIGGVKNMSSFAMIVGMLMGVPIFFKLSAKGKLYQLPGLPVSVDYSFVLRKDIHSILEKLDNMVSCHEFEKMMKVLSKEDREKIIPIVERISVDGRCYASFSTFGQIIWEATHSRAVVLKHRAGELKFVSSKSEEHSKGIIRKFHVIRKFSKIPFVTKVEVISFMPQETGYIKVHHMEGRKFKVTLPIGGSTFDLIVETTAETEPEIKIAEKELKQYLEDIF